MNEIPADAVAIRRGGKSAGAFRTISEVADELAVPQHVLRFWESKFARLKPLKRGGGRRYYRPEDVILLRQIKSLLYNDGYTIKGVQKLLRESGQKAEKPALASVPGGGGKSQKDEAEATLDIAPGTQLSDVIKAAVVELEALRDLLKRRH